ncbi:ferredoxin [Streptomyces sp. L500]
MPTLLRVDQRECIGSGLCASMHPNLFRLTDGGTAEAVRTALTDPDDVEFAQDVADCCPGAAVSLDDPEE